MGPVKSARPTRAERAQQTRHRMLDSARTLFISDGYAATTMERIAETAGVAVQTLYYTFRTKGQLLCEVVETTAAGDEEVVPVAQRAWVRDMLTAPSGPRVLALAVEHGADIFVRAAPLWPVVTAAAADPHVEHYWRRVATDRRAGQARMVARLAELGVLRPGLEPDRATDLVVVLFGHDVFRSLVTQAGWSVPEYKAWLFTTLAQQLLQRHRLPPTAHSDLSYSHLITT
ncbi:TetR/AcrR family transcriptional regulator [Terrabacter sp. GCM10028922]|uniref:TetR/AcrR family transcriptional regulator n=1 Tax=Terrabacter sp. GCM10028922 TaxID=3273428 RepID=UPI003617A243